MTQEDFSKLFHISRSLISKWETEACLPSIEKVNLIANYFNVSYDYIFNLSNIRTKKFMRTELNSEVIGCRVKQIRKNNNLTLRQLADKLHTTSSTISAYEKGKTVLLTAFALEICKRYNISMDWLYGKVD